MKLSFVLLLAITGCKSKPAGDEPPPPPPRAAPPPVAALPPVVKDAGWASQQLFVRGKAFPTSAAVDSRGHTIVAAQAEGQVFVGDKAFEAGDGAVLLVSIAANGDVAWTKLLGERQSLELAFVDVDSKDAIVLTATLRGTTGVGPEALTSAGDKDVLLAKLGADGKPAWSHRFGGAEADRPTNVAVGADDTISIGGYYAGAADFGGKKLTGKNSAEMFVARYSSAGKLVFANRISGGGEEQSELYKVAVDPKGNLVAVGGYAGQLDLGGKPFKGKRGTFVVGYAPSGAVAWTTAYAPSAMTLATVLATDGTGNVFLTGADMNMPSDQNGMVAFDATTGAPKQGAMVGFVAALGPDHQPAWTLPIGDEGLGGTTNVVVAADGALLLAGATTSPAFGDAALADGVPFYARVSAAGKLIAARAIPNAERPAVIATRKGVISVVVETPEGVALLHPE